MEAFLGWASSVAREGEAEEAREEARYEERAEDAAAEAALGRARVAVLKDLVSEGRAVGAEVAGGEGGSGEGSGGGGGAAGAGAPLADADALPLAAPVTEGGVTVQELAALLAAARKRPQAEGEGEGEGEGDEDLLDWRGGKKRRAGW